MAEKVSLDSEIHKSDKNENKVLEDGLKDDTPGVKGEIMFINTDSFDECKYDLDTRCGSEEESKSYPSQPTSPIKQVKEGQVF